MVPLSLKRIVDGAYRVAMGNANAYLLDAGPDLVLVDAGFPGKASLVLDAIRALGRRPSELKHLVFTHGHPDHIGSAAALIRETGATTYMHEADVTLAETGGPFRPMTGAPASSNASGSGCSGIRTSGWSRSRSTGPSPMETCWISPAASG